VFWWCCEHKVCNAMPYMRRFYVSTIKIEEKLNVKGTKKGACPNVDHPAQVIYLNPSTKVLTNPRIYPAIFL
jgi:hypothetical protein